MTSYSIQEICEAVNGIFLQEEEVAINYLAVDSRKLQYAPHSLFFAIKTTQQDGHKYIKDCYTKGVRAFIVNKEIENPLPGAAIIQVADTLSALQNLATHHRSKFNLPLISITGSNGKTIIKEWLAQLLRENYKIVKNPKSYNSQIGVPLSVWQINSEHTLGIFEAGISKPDEMERLQDILQPTIGIFTNIGHAHDEGFNNRIEKIKEKLKLFKHVQVLIYCKDHQEVHKEIIKLRDLKTIAWSARQEADLSITSIAKQSVQTVIHYKYKNTASSINIPFTDDGSIENAIHCLLVLLYLKETNIAEKMQRLSSVKMRLELKDGINNCIIINDAYNTDIESLKIAIDFLNQNKKHIYKSIIISDILQSGLSEIDLYQEVVELLKHSQIDEVIGIGEALEVNKAVFQELINITCSFYLSTDEFLNNYNISDFKDQTILLKGARKFHFEKIMKRLEKKVHDTVLEIDLGALTNNLKVYKSLLKPQTKTMAMVKAFSYGSGSYEIASVLEFNKVDYLAVAYIDEGIELREAGITLPIMVMNNEINSLHQLVQYSLEPEIYSFRIWDKLTEELVSKNVKHYPIHLKIDTGMHRLGFDENDIDEMLRRLENNDSFKVASIFSHLTSSDNETHDVYTRQQYNLLSRVCDNISPVIKYPFLKHLINSAGIIRFPEFQLDMVRLGIGLYGVDTTHTLQHRLQSVGTLKTVITQIRNINQGDHIGYNRTMINKDSTIAVVNIGYADGLDRRLSYGKGYMLVHGQVAPILGAVCMDMTILDITTIKQAKEGDEVMVFGSLLPIQKMANLIGTIPYEVLTNISRRVKRVFYQE